MSMSGKLYKLTRVRTLTLRKSLSRGRAQETVAHHGGNSRFQLDNPAVSRTPEEISKPVYRGKEWQGSRIRPRLRKGIRCCRSKSQERLCYRIHSLRGTLCPRHSPTTSPLHSLEERSANLSDELMILTSGGAMFTTSLLPSRPTLAGRIPSS